MNLTVTVSGVSGKSSLGPTSGLMGFGFSGLAVNRNIPFWQALVNNKPSLLQTPEMSFFFTRSKGTSVPVEQNGGVFTLGGTNSTLFTGNIEFINTSNSTSLPTGFWPLELTGTFYLDFLL
jgi:cathepsin D